jgi:serine/threonine protein kinase
VDRARLIDLVGEALDLPAAEREPFLRARCEDAALLAEGLSLIAAEKTAGGFLDRPTVHGLASAPASEGVGSTIGPYRLLELIGESPEARVYMAQRRDDARRRVALRVAGPAAHATEAVAHFEAARSAIGTHAGIPVLLDSGVCGDGAYLVTELVRGVSITTHAERLPEAERTWLVLAAIDAVAHAHARGVVHLNLSPRNIVVTQVGSEVKVLDFGVLRADHPDPSSLAGELRAAVAGGGAPERGCGARADVRALGDLLSRLLPGTPADAVGRGAADPDPSRRFESAGVHAAALRREWPRRAGRRGWLSRILRPG